MTDADMPRVGARVEPETKQWLEEENKSVSKVIREALRQKQSTDDRCNWLEQRREQLHSEIDELQIERDAIDDKIEAKRDELADVEDRLEDKRVPLSKCLDQYFDGGQYIVPDAPNTGPGSDPIVQMAERAGVSRREAWDAYVERYEQEHGQNTGRLRG
jgi:DNA repair exonuclease SbcCD ATPase subunit